MSGGDGMETKGMRRGKGLYARHPEQKRLFGMSACKGVDAPKEKRMCGVRRQFNGALCSIWQVVAIELMAHGH